MRYRFGNFVLDTETHQILRKDAPLKVEPQVFDILKLFVLRPGTLITKDDLIEEIWCGRIVSDASINSRIRSARQAIGDNGTRQKFIKTLHRRGFMFVASVEIENPQTENIYTQSNPGAAQANAAPVSLASSAKTEQITTPTRLYLILNSHWGLLGLAAAAIIALAVVFLPNFSERNSASPASELTASADPFSIAVMPFLDMSADKDLQYLSDGFSEELLNVLSGLGELKVSSRTSAFMFRDSTRSMNEIGEALNVRYIIEGSLRRAGDNFRIAVQLIDVESDRQVWSQTFDRDFDPENFFDVQDEIARNVVDVVAPALQVSRDPDEQSELASQPTQSPRAYEAFLRGNILREKGNREAYRLALEQYDLAITVDPDFAKAYAARAATYVGLMVDGYYGAESTDENAALMERDIEKALSLAPNDPLVLTMAARVAEARNDFERVLELTQKIIDMDVNFASAYEDRGKAYFILGQYDKAEEALEQARQLNPLSSDTLVWLGDVKYILGDTEGALEIARDNYRWNNDRAAGLELLIYLLSETGDYAGSHELIQEAIAINPDDLWRRDELVTLYGELGMREEALKAATTPHLTAWAYSVLGEPDNARPILDEVENLREDGEMMFGLAMFEEARVRFERLEKSRAFDKLTDMPSGQGRIFQALCYTFTQTGSSRATHHCGLVRRHYESLQPQDVVRNSDLRAGMAWFLMDGQTNRAIEWYRELTGRGYMNVNQFKHPMYASMLKVPEAQKIFQKMQTEAASQAYLIREGT